MGDGTKENPYTREDVLRLIEENGGTAEGLDLSGKVFEEGINLRGLDLIGVILSGATLFKANLKEVYLCRSHLEKARLWDAHLEESDLIFAHLEESELMNAHLEGALLSDAHLERACLGAAHLEGARLFGTYLEGAELAAAEISPDTRLEEVDWGNYVLGDERKGWFLTAADVYRRLKTWYHNAGMYDIAGKFFYREMATRRKAFFWGPSMTYFLTELSRPVKLKKVLRAVLPRKPLHWAWCVLLDILCGYGEKPLRVVISAAAVVFGLAAAYYFWGSFSSSSFWDTLYYSAASFTALGYGQWAPQPAGWAKGIGAAEAIIGVFMIALFLVTFTRKMTR